MSDAADFPPPEEPPMEIHKPKPMHNWRELLIEIGVVVIGVVVALAAEQAVEWLHWQSEVTAARQAIHDEIGVNNANLFAFRVATASCLERQADEAQGILDDLEARRSPRHFTTFHNGFGFPLRDSDWQAERSAQSLNHFPRSELALIGRYYAAFGEFEIWYTGEREAWRTLSVLRQPPKEIPVSDLLRLRAALMTARDTERLVKLNAVRELNLSRQIGVDAMPLDPKRVEKFCTLDYEAYNKYILSLEPRQ